MSKKVKKPDYVRLDTLSVQSGLAWIQDYLHAPEKGFRVQVGDHEIHLTSLRLRTFFHKGTTCCRCGLEASFFSIEHQPRSNSAWPHMNLYGVSADGQEVLFTKDHIQSRKEGGKDTLANMQTMCRPCNNAKGSVSDKPMEQAA